MSATNAEKETLNRQRYEILQQIEDWFEIPIVFLGFVWLGILVLDLTRGLNPFLTAVGTIIWIVFIIDFFIRLALAPHKTLFLKRNWLTAISLFVPAVRVLRVVRTLQIASRSARLIRVVGSLNRGMRAIGSAMKRRGFSYVVALSAIVLLAGSAGMYAFEGQRGGIQDYGTAVWWTAMILTTMGSDYWPKTAEGRVLCVLLALYSFAVFGYVTATLASYFVGRDAESPESDVASDSSLKTIAKELREMRRELEALRNNSRE